MKELTIEEKAKRYDEALKKAKRLYEEGTITECLCHIFPELKESEDEKIKEAISAGLCDVSCDFGWSDFGGVPIEDIFAWLEKAR